MRLIQLLLACSAPPSGSGLSDPDDTGHTHDSDGADDALDDGPLDAALLMSVDYPTALDCGEQTTARIAMKNAGTTTWTRADDVKLGALDDEDPLHPGDSRIWLEEGDAVAPGETWSFEFSLVAPQTEGLYTSDWQMVREGVHWFGDSVTRQVDVVCEASPDEVPPLDLSEVEWLHSDVSEWAETSTLSSVTVSGDQICMDYDKTDTWPIEVIDGTELVGNPWIFIHQDGTWYGATWEWLRPGQTCKTASSVAGDHIKQEPFGEDSGWVPTSGETYYFMVSGLARFSERNVEERTAPVKLVWP